MSLSPRSALRTGSCQTFKAVCYGRNLSSYMEQMEDEYRWATSKVTGMIGEINTMRSQVHDLMTDMTLLEKRSKSLETERKELLQKERARRKTEKEEKEYYGGLIEHLLEADKKIQLRPCIVEQTLKDKSCMDGEASSSYS